MAYKNAQYRTDFMNDMKNVENAEESLFQEAVNRLVRIVELDEKYSTKQKLAIYSNITILSNCMEKERMKYAKKLAKLL